MSTQEQATFIGQQLERKLSFFNNCDILYDTRTDGEYFYVDVVPKDGEHCITSVAMGCILNVVKQHHLKYFITASFRCKPTISIY